MINILHFRSKWRKWRNGLESEQHLRSRFLVLFTPGQKGLPKVDLYFSSPNLLLYAPFFSC